MIIAIELQKDQFLFYAESAVATKKWFKCCGLLLSLPCHFIPIVPEENLIPQSLIDKYEDNHILDAGRLCVFVTAIANCSIGCKPTLTALLEYSDDTIITL